MSSAAAFGAGSVCPPPSAAGTGAAGAYCVQTSSATTARAPQDRPAGAPSPRFPTRVPLALDQPVVAELIKLTLDHRAFETGKPSARPRRWSSSAGGGRTWWCSTLDLEGVNGARVMERIASDVAGGSPPSP